MLLGKWHCFILFLTIRSMRDHVEESICHIDDGDEEDNVDEEWTEHLPLEGKDEIQDKDEAADDAANEEVEKTIELYK